MRECKARLFAVLLIMCLAPALLWAQDQEQPSAPPADQSSTPPQARQRGAEPPCFKQAGVSDDTWKQIMGIHKTTHQQVVSICENSSLSTQQKRDQIRQAREQTEQQVQGLLTPQQQNAVKQCRKERRGGRGGMRGMHRGGGDPCARIMRQNNKGQGGPPPESPEQQ